jgi:hypothetical protein
VPRRRRDWGFLYEELALPAAERSLPCERLALGDAFAVFAEGAAMSDKVEY